MATLAVSANDDLVNRFREVAVAAVAEGDFRNQSEFVEHLLTLHAAQQMSYRLPTIEGAVSAIRELTDRVTKVVVGAGETMITNQE